MLKILPVCVYKSQIIKYLDLLFILKKQYTTEEQEIYIGGDDGDA